MADLQYGSTVGGYQIFHNENTCTFSPVFNCLTVSNSMSICGCTIDSSSIATWNTTSHTHSCTIVCLDAGLAKVNTLCTGPTSYAYNQHLCTTNSPTFANLLICTVTGQGIRFWGSPSYSIYMGLATDTTYGGRITGDTTSEYNMYHRMSSGTNRGFTFETSYACKLFSINPSNVISNPAIIINCNAGSTSTTTGSLIVTGGVGISQHINIGGSLCLCGCLVNATSIANWNSASTASHTHSCTIACLDAGLAKVNTLCTGPTSYAYNQHLCTTSSPTFANVRASTGLCVASHLCSTSTMNCFSATSQYLLGTTTCINSTNVVILNDLCLYSGTIYIPDSSFLRIGYNAGYRACYSEKSNFIGYNAGANACYSSYSNFIGTYAGYQACYSEKSNFIGSDAGCCANNSPYSNFIGYDAGKRACNSPCSNFIGYHAGANACYSENSNFIGSYAGANTYCSINSNFIGSYAGYQSCCSCCSNFIGYNAGYQVTNSNNLLLIGNCSIILNCANSLTGALICGDILNGGVRIRGGITSDTTLPIRSLVSRGHIYFNSAIAENGNLYVWGQTYGSTSFTNGYPIASVQKQPIISATVYGHIKCARALGDNLYVLTCEGYLYASGNNTVGALGTGNTTSQCKLVAVACNVCCAVFPESNGGNSMAYRIFYKGTNNCWYGAGYNTYGALGIGNTTNQCSFCNIACLGTTTCQLWNLGSEYGMTVARKTTGEVLVAGMNTYGQLGICTNVSQCCFINACMDWNIASTQNILCATGGYGYRENGTLTSRASTMMLISPGYVRTAGNNLWGQLGVTTNAGTDKVNCHPTLVTGISGYSTKIMTNITGVMSAYAKTEYGCLYSWGYNGTGQLGIGNTTSICTPTITCNTICNFFAVGGLYNFGYFSHLFIENTNGDWYASGYNSDGQLGIGTNVSVCCLTQLTYNSNINGRIIDITTNGFVGTNCALSSVTYLTESGKLYTSGTGGLNLGYPYAPLSTPSNFMITEILF